MTGHGSKFGRKKEEAIAALLSQRSVEEAARVVNVPVRTLYRWMKEAEFQAAYREARCAAFSQCAARLQHLSAAAVSTLGKVMLDLQAPAASRVRAAHTILEQASRALELEDLEARLAVLESAVKAETS